MTPKAAGSTFSMTSEAEHLVRLRKWLRDELAVHGGPKQEQPNLLLAVSERIANTSTLGGERRGEEHRTRAREERATVYHWMILSARCSSVCGMASPSAFAVYKLMTSSNLVGCSTGRSAGFAPLKILST